VGNGYRLWHFNNHAAGSYLVHIGTLSTPLCRNHPSVRRYLAKIFLKKLPQKYFRIFVGIFLALIGIILTIQS
jgi:hypothetical protein